MAGNRPNFSLFTKLFLLVLINLFPYPLIEANNGGGFSTHLIHRDSPRSPTYNPSDSHSERLYKAILRSNARAEYIMKTRLSENSPSQNPPSNQTFQSYISYGGDYLIKVTVGTPPVDLLAIADTGSDITWLGCKPCDKCFKNAPNAPVFFDPESSSTFEYVSCDSPLCFGGCGTNNKCQYSVSYIAGSFCNGDLSQETFTFKSKSNSTGGNISFSNIVFGCAHNATSDFTTGLVGLGGGQLSIVTQLEGSIGGKFSHCLLPSSSNSSSMIKFGGQNPALLSPRTVSTPLIDRAYSLHLQAMIVGKTRVPYNIEGYMGDGYVLSANIIIDTGTTLTYVPKEFYRNLTSEIIKQVNATRVPDPGSYFELCYKDEESLRFPKIYAQFGNDAYVVLPPDGTSIPVGDGIVCFGIVSENEWAIFGNKMQTNYLIEFDLENMKLSFLRTDCRRYK